MYKRTLVLAAVVVPFAVVTVLTLVQVGYVAVFTTAFASIEGAQVFLDLCVSLTLVLTWVVSDARRQGLAAWPFVLLTLAGGSLGPLCYLGVRAWRGATTPPMG